MKFDIITTVRVANDQLYAFINECQKMNYEEFQVPFDDIRSDHTRIVLAMSGQTPAEAEAFIQFCIRFNAVEEILMPA